MPFRRHPSWHDYPGLKRPSPQRQTAAVKSQASSRVPKGAWSAVACYRLGSAKLASPRAIAVGTNGPRGITGYICQTPYLDVDKAAGISCPCGVWTTCGSKLPRVKAQASCALQGSSTSQARHSAHDLTACGQFDIARQSQAEGLARLRACQRRRAGNFNLDPLDFATRLGGRTRNVVVLH
jgi:hypothetical protein